MQLIALVSEAKSIVRYLTKLGESTDVPSRSTGRGPAYWKSTCFDYALIVLGTLRLRPSVAMSQAALGCCDAKYLQIDAGCSGFLDALLVANALLNAGAYRTALVIGADAVTVYNDPWRFIALTIFGDGAGANRANIFSDGDVLLMTSAGAGLAWGGAVWRWYERDHR